MTDALFRINADVSNQGFDATNAQVLTFTLKTLPLSGVRSWELQVFDVTAYEPTDGIDSNPPRQSPGAVELTLVGATTGKRVSPTNVTGSITSTMPVSGSYSWIVRSKVNGGKRLTANGAVVDDPSLIHERMVSIRNVNGVRPIVATETRQYSNDGWCQAVNEAIQLAGSTDYPGVPVQRYLPGAGGDLRNAFANALDQNPSARRFVFPAGEYVWTSTLRQFGGPLRNDIIMEGHDTWIRRVNGSGVGILLQWTTTTEPMQRVRITGMNFRNEDPTAVVFATYSYNCDEVIVDHCKFVNVPFTPLSADGTRFPLSLFGAHRCAVVHNYFERAQAACAGLGSSCEDVLFAHNIGQDVDDFLFSAATGGATGLSVKRLKVSDNIINGSSGAGVFLIGTDGEVIPADELSGVEISNNIIRGARAEPFGVSTAYYPIAFWPGLVTKGCSIKNNSIDVGTAHGAYGIFVRGLAGTFVEDLSIDGNDVDFTNAHAATVVNGIQALLVNGKRIHVRDNHVKGSRGIIVSNADKVRIMRNEVEGGQINLTADVRNATDWRVHKNNVEALSGINALQISATNFSLADVLIEQNDLYRFDGWGVGCSLIGGGTVAMRLHNNPRLGQRNDYSADMKASVVSAYGNNNLP